MLELFRDVGVLRLPNSRWSFSTGDLQQMDLQRRAKRSLSSVWWGRRASLLSVGSWGAPPHLPGQLCSRSREGNPSHICLPSRSAASCEVLNPCFTPSSVPGHQPPPYSPADTISLLSYRYFCASCAPHSPCPTPHCKRHSTGPCLKCCVVLVSSHLVARHF